MTYDEFLKEAERRYPVGSEFYPIHIPESMKVSGNSYVIREGDKFVWYAAHICIKDKNNNDVYTVRNNNLATVYSESSKDWAKIFNSVIDTRSNLEEAKKRYLPGIVFCPAHLCSKITEDKHTVVHNNYTFEESSSGNIYLRSSVPGYIFNKGNWNPMIYDSTTKTWAPIVSQTDIITKSFDIRTDKWSLKINEFNLPYVIAYRNYKDNTLCRLSLEDYSYINEEGYGRRQNTVMLPSTIFVSDYDFISYVRNLTGFNHQDLSEPRRADTPSKRYGVKPFDTPEVRQCIANLMAQPLTPSEAFKINESKPQLEDIPVKKRVLL